MYPKTGAVTAGAAGGSLAYTGFNSLYFVAAAFTLICVGVALTTGVTRPAFAGFVNLFRRKGRH